MSEIPGPVWVIVGIFIGGVSLFLGFFSTVQNSSFFKLMFFVGIGMIAFGLFKMKIKEKTIYQRLEERRYQSLNMGEREVEIDIDDYRRNPNLRQQVLSQAGKINYSHYVKPGAGYPSTGQDLMQTGSRQHHSPKQSHPTAHHSHSQHHATLAVKGRFCTECGTPLLKEHKFCPVCGART